MHGTHSTIVSTYQPYLGCNQSAVLVLSTIRVIPSLLPYHVSIFSASRHHLTSTKAVLVNGNIVQISSGTIGLHILQRFVPYCGLQTAKTQCISTCTKQVALRATHLFESRRLHTFPLLNLHAEAATFARLKKSKMRHNLPR